jgi:hypothetical protein
MLGVGKTAREDGSVWVSDNAAVDSLLMATGVPSLSGRQIAGPDKDAWQQLDPNPADEALWNRGGAYVWFEWTDSPTVTLDNPGADIIHVVASPCTVAERMPDVTRIVASHRLSDDCLTKVSTFVWGGAPHFVYAVDR